METLSIVTVAKMVRIERDNGQAMEPGLAWRVTDAGRNLVAEGVCVRPEGTSLECWCSHAGAALPIPMLRQLRVMADTLQVGTASVLCEIEG